VQHFMCDMVSISATGTHWHRNIQLRSCDRWLGQEHVEPGILCFLACWSLKMLKEFLTGTPARLKYLGEERQYGVRQGFFCRLVSNSNCTLPCHCRAAGLIEDPFGSGTTPRSKCRSTKGVLLRGNPAKWARLPGASTKAWSE
jgi:hypothetical protein